MVCVLILIAINLGVNRSATIVIAYLMKEEGLALEEALARVLAVRQISLNPLYLTALQGLDKKMSAQVKR